MAEQGDRTTAAGALARLVDAYDRRAAAISDPTTDAARVVAHLGADLPRPLVEAAGLVPVRVAGAVTSPRADAILGPGVDAAYRRVLERLLDGVDAALLVAGHESEAAVRAYHAARWLAAGGCDRTGQRVAGDLPPVHLLDLVHLDRPTTAAYDRAEVERFVARLDALAGAPVTAGDRRAAVADAERARRAGAALMEARGLSAARVSGVTALAIAGAHAVLPARQFAALAEAAVDEVAELAPLGGPRVYVTGSSHPTPTLYATIEAAGATIVGEDHESGEEVFRSPWDLELDPVDAVVARHLGSPTSRGVPPARRAAYVAGRARATAAHAVVQTVRVGDDRHVWDRPAIAAALERIGVPFVPLARHDIDVGDPAALAEPIRRLAEQASA